MQNLSLVLFLSNLYHFHVTTHFNSRAFSDYKYENMKISQGRFHNNVIKYLQFWKDCLQHNSPRGCAYSWPLQILNVCFTFFSISLSLSLSRFLFPHHSCCVITVFHLSHPFSLSFPQFHLPSVSFPP